MIIFSLWKLTNKSFVYCCEEVAKLSSTEWYFFSFRDRKYATGFRTNRATTCGYWKATGKDRTVVEPRSQAIIGMRKTLVFYKNRAPNGVKTDWIMHEFRLENSHIPPKVNISHFIISWIDSFELNCETWFIWT